MKQHRRIIFLMGFCFITLFLLCTSAHSDEKVISLRYSNQFAPGTPLSAIGEQWCKEVEKRTNEKVKVRYYTGSTLNAPPQTYDSVVQGVVDVGNHVLGYTMGKFPLSEVFDYPLGYPSGQVATKLVNAYFNKFKPKEFDDVKVMYMHACGPGYLHTRTKPVNKLEDLKGLRIRTSGSTARFMQLLGGVPVAMPMGDTYDAVSRGVADGMFAVYEALKNWKLGEVIKYTTENKVTYVATWTVVMNKEKWNSIPPDLQKIIEQINLEWADRQGKVWDQIDQEGKEFSLKRGNKVITLSAEENARWGVKAQPLFDEYVTKTKEKNLPGSEVLKFAREYLKNQSGQ